MTCVAQFWLFHALGGLRKYIIQEIASFYGKCQHHTWQFDWLLEVIKVELGKDAKSVVVF